MSEFEYGNGFIVAIARSENALDELRGEEKNVLYEDGKGYVFLPMNYRLTDIEDSAKEMLDGLMNSMLLNSIQKTTFAFYIVQLQMTMLCL